MKHTLVAPEDIDTVWSKVEDLIKKTNDEFLNDNDIYNLLKEGVLLLWIVADNNTIITAMTLIFQKYPRNSTLRIVTCGGSRLNEWLDEFLVKI